MSASIYPFTDAPSAPRELHSLSELREMVGEACGTIAQSWVHLIGLVSLWTAAVLTCVTGWDYLRVGLNHMD